MAHVQALTLAPPYRLPFTLIRDRPDLVSLVVLCGIGLAVRLAFTTRAPVFLTKDSFEYFQPAYDLVNGLGFDLALRRPPIYPLFAAGVMTVLGESLAAI